MTLKGYEQGGARLNFLTIFISLDFVTRLPRFPVPIAQSLSFLSKSSDLEKAQFYLHLRMDLSQTAKKFFYDQSVAISINN